MRSRVDRLWASVGMEWGCSNLGLFALVLAPVLVPFWYDMNWSGPGRCARFFLYDPVKSGPGPRPQPRSCASNADVRRLNSIEMDMSHGVCQRQITARACTELHTNAMFTIRSGARAWWSIMHPMIVATHWRDPRSPPIKIIINYMLKKY